MTYTDSNNITFSNVTDPGLVFGGSPIAYNGAYPTSGDTVTFSNDNHLMVNAIDIDWNGAEIGNNVTINTTGDLIAWIKGIETSGGSGSVTVSNKNAEIGKSLTTIATVGGTDIKVKAAMAGETADGYISKNDYRKLHPSPGYTSFVVRNIQNGWIQLDLGSGTGGSKVSTFDVRNTDLNEILFNCVSEEPEFWDYTWYFIVPSTTTSVDIRAYNQSTYPVQLHKVINVSDNLAAEGETNIIKVTAHYMANHTNTGDDYGVHYFIDCSISKNDVSTAGV